MAFLFGTITGIIIHTRFKGITAASSEVQGLTYVSCLVTVLAGMFLGSITGVVIQNPFTIITTASSDIRGLTYISWFVTVLAGLVFGAIADLSS